MVELNGIVERKHRDLQASVVIPAHNAADTIRRTIDSIKAQTIQPIEIVVGCDGCTDSTAEIARSLGAIAVEIPKSTGAAARNAAFQKTTGNIIFLVDADDEWKPRKIEAHFEAYRQFEPPFVIDPSRRIRANGELRGLNGAGPSGWRSWEDMVEHKNWSSGSGISATREAWEKVGGFNPELKGLQDIDFLIRCAYFAGQGYHIEECCTRYHLTEGGLSRTTSWQQSIIDGISNSCPFLEPKHIQSIKRTVALRNALLAGPKEFWSNLKWGDVSLADPRVWKLYALTVLNSRKH